MSISIPERDWKYMRKLNPELLDELCGRINSQTEAILSDTDISNHKKFLAVFDHIDVSNNIVAECFDDWRRSTIFLRLLALQKHNLLKDEHIRNLSEEVQKKLTLLKQ
jgi:hypothetical protein